MLRKISDKACEVKDYLGLHCYRLTKPFTYVLTGIVVFLVRSKGNFIHELWCRISCSLPAAITTSCKLLMTPSSFLCDADCQKCYSSGQLTIYQAACLCLLICPAALAAWAVSCCGFCVQYRRWSAKPGSPMVPNNRLMEEGLLCSGC